MLTTFSSRLVRPAVKAAQRASSPTRARFATTAPRAQNNGSKLARERMEHDGRVLTYPRRYSLAPRPFRLSTDFFPDQVGSIFRDIEDEIARLWGDDGSSEPPQLASKALGAVDIRETKDSFIFTLDTPGLTKQDVSVRVTPENVLVVSGERNMEEKREEDGFHRYERAYGKFQRRFVLPEHVDTKAIKAEVKHGELAVTVPKKEKEGRQLTEIQVEDATASQEDLKPKEVDPVQQAA